MFTINQVKEAHSKVKSGADFPAYVQEIIKLDVTSYETFVSDGHTLYHGLNDFSTQSNAKYPVIEIAEQSDGSAFRQDLEAHQQGKTDYPAFCRDCARSGIEKWIVDTAKMTCTYFDKANNEILVEIIPANL
jgi:uncharacterized protein YbcV (DUF1398 family)